MMTTVKTAISRLKDRCVIASNGSVRMVLATQKLLQVVRMVRNAIDPMGICPEETTRQVGRTCSGSPDCERLCENPGGNRAEIKNRGVFRFLSVLSLDHVVGAAGRH